MYYPYGIPTLLRIPQKNVQEIIQVVCNRDKVLSALLTEDSVIIWYVKPCVPIISHRRSRSSLAEIGKNVLVQWRPDSSMIVVATDLGHLVIYHLALPVDVKTLYELKDSPTPSLRRDKDELYIKEVIPPLFFSLAFEVEIEGGVADLVAIRDELMIATKSGKILRYSWEGQEVRDYSLDLRRIPFCVDQQVLRAVPLADKNVFVTKIAYSPLIGGYAVVLNDGRAALLVASSSSFDPNSVTGIWALQLEDANSIALNHKYKLIAFGRKNSHAIVYTVDELTGGLLVSHRLVLPARDYPGCPGSVTCLKWTPDGTALAMSWERGGFSIWSTFGALIMCSFCWDYGPSVSDPISQNPLCVKSMDWSAEGYQMWIVNSATRSKVQRDPELPLFPNQFQTDETDAHEARSAPLANKALIMQFLKSPASVNPSMTKLDRIFLQGEDTIFINQSQGGSYKSWRRAPQMSDISSSSYELTDEGRFLMTSSTSKLWLSVTVPHGYFSTSWPIRYTAIDDASEYLAVAGRAGFAHYSFSKRKWRLFGNEYQEKSFIVTGGLLWWRDQIIMGSYNVESLQDEIRIYPRREKLDNSFAKIYKVDSQVLLLNLFGEQLIAFCADSVVYIFNLSLSEPDNGDIGTVELILVQSFDISIIPGLNFHPACVVLVAMSNLKIEASRSGNRESFPREATPSAHNSSGDQGDVPSLILNICGRVFMLQIERKKNEIDSQQLSLPTVLATGCELIWFPKTANVEKPHLTWSLWLYCGAAGMKVWLPIFPREGDNGLNFMSKRIMLYFPIEKFYPLSILFEDAIILGAETDTVMYSSKLMSSSVLPFANLERTSMIFLQPILRQLIRKNLGYHAWEIARTCMALPYFQHSLELLLHEVLEEEATSKEPIPDALLPSVVDFIQEFPVYHQTVGRCARKTEVALWPHLFAAIGSPKILFLESLNRNDLETAASYLLILQNLEPPLMAQTHASQLLEAALDACSWDLARELVRFLKTIDPEDIEEAPLRPAFFSPQSPALNGSAQEEEISLLLGTLQVPRGRATSLNQKHSPKDLQKEIGRSYHSESKPPQHNRSRKVSTSSQKDAKQNTDEFFIDVVLQRHARKLLAAFQLHDLGTFAAQLNFQMVAWLKKENSRVRLLDNSVQALRSLHADFQWPYPILVNSVLTLPKSSSPSVISTSSKSPDSSARNGSLNSSGASVSGNPRESIERSSLLMGDKFRTLKLDNLSSLSTRVGHKVSDSGYVSHATEETLPLDPAFSEQPVHAFLKPSEFKEDLSLMSEDVVSIAGPDDRLDAQSLADWPVPKTSHPLENFQEFSSKGSQKSEVQLRYLLQIMLESSCLEIAAIISILLKDALSLVRITNAARMSSEMSCVSRLFQSLKAVEAWAQSECHGYAPFFQVIQPQLNSLKVFLMQSPKGPRMDVTPPLKQQTPRAIGKFSPSGIFYENSSRFGARKGPMSRSLSTPSPTIDQSGVNLAENGVGQSLVNSSFSDTSSTGPDVLDGSDESALRNLEARESTHNESCIVS